MEWLTFLKILSFFFMTCCLMHSTSGYFVKKGNGTFLFNGIFPITNGNGKINHQRGFIMSEAMKWAIETVNAQKNYLYGYKLGISNLYDSSGNQAVRKNILQTFIDEIPFLIGPYSAETSYLTSILTVTLDQIAISYSATYSDFDLYGIQDQYMLRTVPSDKFRIEAAISLIKKLFWNYMAVVSSYGHDGEREALHFTKKLSSIDACLAIQIDLVKFPTTKDYQHAIDLLNTDSRLNGIILFTTVHDTKNILKQLKATKLQKRFALVCIYGCMNYIEVVEGNEEVADGTLSLDIHHREIAEFRKYFLKKKINSKSSKIFKQFWEETFDCTMNGVNVGNYSNRCSGEEKLSVGKGYYPNTPVHTVIDAVFDIAQALHDFIGAYCQVKEQPKPWEHCDISAEEKDKYSKWIFQLLFKESYSDGTMKPSQWYSQIEANKIVFDAFQYHYNQSDLALVWRWAGERGYDDNDDNYVSHEETNFVPYTKDPNYMLNFKSKGICSRECQPGYVKEYDKNSLKAKCCWSCLKCPKNHRVENNTCLSCKVTEMVAHGYKKCKSLPEVQIQWYQFPAAMFVFLSTIGLLSAGFVALIFVKFSTNRVVRASGRDLSYIILVGICLIFVCPITFLTRTSNASCILRGALPGFAFLTCYVPLFLRTNRIYRIFVGALVSVSPPPLVSSGSQFIGLGIILAIQLLINVVWFASKVPSPVVSVYNGLYITMHCSGDDSPILLLLNLSLSVIFMISCTVLAFKTRRFPKNFNEAKYIGITLYITCVAWAVFLPAYFLVPRMDSNFLKEYLMCIICMFIGYVTLFGLFGQKIKMLLISPKEEPNTNGLPTWYVRPHSKSLMSNASYYATTPEANTERSELGKH